MKVTFDEDPKLGKVTIVRADGRLDAHGAVAFWEAAGGRVTPQKPFVLLDLSRVAIITSAGVGILIRLHARAQQNGGAVVVSGAEGRVLRVLDLVNLAPVLGCVPDEPSARETLKKNGAA